MEFLKYKIHIINYTTLFGKVSSLPVLNLRTEEYQHLPGAGAIISLQEIDVTGHVFGVIRAFSI